MRNIVLSLAALAAELASPAAAEPTLAAEGAGIVWMRTFASAGDDWVNDIVPLKDGSFLAVGFLNRVDGTPPSDWRALAVKFSGEGAIGWRKEFGAGGMIDAFWSAREGEEGALMLAGFSSRLGPGGINAYFARLGADGALLKENAYGTAGYDRVTSLAPTPAGFLGAGHAEGQDGRDVFLIHVDREGVETWRRVFARKGSNGALYVEPAGDGNFIVAGGTDEEGDADILVLKIDPEGNEIWRKTIGERGTDDVNHGLVVRSDGRIVVAGYTQSWGAGERDLMAAVLDASGNLVRLETLGGAGDDRALLAKADAEGRVFIVGQTTSAGAGGADALLVVLEPDGSFRDGAILIGGALDDHGAAVRPLAGSDVLIGGYSKTLGGGSEDAFIARLSLRDVRSNPAFTISKVK